MSQPEATDDGKAHFDHVYDQPDPRAYYRTLGALDYEIPQRALPVVQTLVGALPRSERPGPPQVLDVCCSYGINAALLRYELTLDELHRRYADPIIDELSAEELAQSDREWLADRRRPGAPRVTGLDAARNAVAYACRADLLDDGWVEDLEAGDPSSALADELADVDLVVVTGGVGYITERTFGRLVAGRPDGSAPWIASMVLRIYPFDEIAATLTERGLVTEQLASATFPQRRFADEREHAAAVDMVQARGLDPAGLEDDGRFHAELFVSRPAADVERQPLAELLAGVVLSPPSGT